VQVRFELTFFSLDPKLQVVAPWQESLPLPSFCPPSPPLSLSPGLPSPCGLGVQVRFELTFFSLDPKLQVVAPWREWDIRGREDAIEYAKLHNVPVPVTKKSIYSRDRNLWHISHEVSRSRSLRAHMLRVHQKDTGVLYRHRGELCTSADQEVHPLMRPQPGSP